MKNKTVIYVIISILISGTILFSGYTKVSTPQELYRVYLRDKTIGYVESKEELENYIDNVETSIKNKFNVDKVYAPNELKIVKETTYNQKVSSASDIYNKIKNISPFTVKGYKVKIYGIEEVVDEKKKKAKDTSIYVLKKEVFEDAIKVAIKAFISEEEYNSFIQDTQKEITDTGKIIENLYIKNSITIKEYKIPVDEKIYMDSEVLSKYLVFGTTDERAKYKVNAGDTIDEIAYNNKLSVEEFLIANVEFSSANDLLYAGQIVDVGTVQPLFNFIEEDHVVEYSTSHYKTEIVYDNTVMMGVERVKQEGIDGVNKVTKKIQKSNGDIISAVVVSSDEIKPTKNKIIIRGNGSINVGSLGTWGWPTEMPYVITSSYGWRWGALHDGTDITSTGFGSPIYAANDGVVEIAEYKDVNGNYIIINHNNGYYSLYAHLSQILVSKGDIVSIGQQIGKMGMTGWATGTHLHFAIWNGYPYHGGSYSLDAMMFYK